MCITEGEAEGASSFCCVQKSWLPLMRMDLDFKFKSKSSSWFWFILRAVVWHDLFAHIIQSNGTPTELGPKGGLASPCHRFKHVFGIIIFGTWLIISYSAFFFFIPFINILLYQSDADKLHKRMESFRNIL
jgi:hypothetical protein